MQILYYFLIGAILDILGTLDTQAVVKRKPILSGIVSFIGTVVGTLIIVDFAQNGDWWLTVSYIGAYGIGGSIGGSGMIIFDKIQRKNKRKQQRKKKEVSDGTNTNIL